MDPIDACCYSRLTYQMLITWYCLHLVFRRCAIHMVQKDIGLIEKAEGQVPSAHVPPPYKCHAFSGDVNLSIVKVFLAGLYLRAGPK